MDCCPTQGSEKGYGFPRGTQLLSSKARTWIFSRGVGGRQSALSGQEGACVGVRVTTLLCPPLHMWVALPSHLRPLCLSFLLCNVGPPQALLQRVQ